MPVSPAAVQGYLAGVSYPADKMELLHSARQEGADDAILDILASVGDREYADPSDVMNELGGATLEI